MKGFKGGTTTTQNAQERKEKRQLILATSLCVLFMFAEIVGGYLAGSLAIMTDAAHLLSDCISFIVALVAICLSKKSPDNYMTFGYKRAEVLGAILSIFGIWLLTTFLFYFALSRLLYQDFEINADTMMIVSGVGIFINIIMAIILHGEGLCCFSALTRSHGHCHSHSHGKQDHYDNNNSSGSKGRSEYKPLINETNSILDNGKNVIIPVPSAFITGKSINDRSNSICSYRSPSHSRANSFSRELSRRSSSISNLVAIKVKDLAIVNLHRDSIDNDMSRSLIDIKPSITEEKRHGGCVIDGTICPKHNYIHRDSSENTSDSEDHLHHHHHNNSLFHHHHHHNHSNDFSSKNLNIQAAVIHVLGDFIQSIGVFMAAVIIKFYPNVKIADPLCTFVFSIIVMLTTCRIMKDSVTIILEGVPASISISRFTEDLTSIEGVRSVHYLNVWSLTVGWNLMSAHILIDPFADSSEVLYAATTIAKNGYNIRHCTIQIEKSTPENVHSTNNPHYHNSISSTRNFLHSTELNNESMMNILT